MLTTNTKTTQTAFRFSPDLMLKMKNRARMRGQSLNGYVEELIRKDLVSKEERYEDLYRELAGITLPDRISPEIMSLSKYKPNFSQAEIDADERLSYILSK